MLHHHNNQTVRLQQTQQLLLFTCYGSSIKDFWCERQGDSTKHGQEGWLQSMSASKFGVQ